MTMPMPNPVDAPQVRPPLTGLITTAKAFDRLHEVPDTQFGLGGSVYRSESVGDARARSNADSTHVGSNVNRLANPDDKDGLIRAYPIVLSTEETCAAFGFQVNDYEGRAKRRLEAFSSKILEWEFWTGEVAQLDGLGSDEWQWLAQDTAVDLNPGGAVDPRRAIAMLEEAFGDGGTGAAVLHTGRRSAVMLPDRWEEGPITTWPDSAVVVGSGYPGTGPDGTPAADGERWVYGTNLVDVWLGDVHLFPETIEEALDRRKNTISYRAERLGAASWDGNIHVAIRVTV